MEAKLGKFTIELKAPTYEAIRPTDDMILYRGRTEPTQQEIYDHLKARYDKIHARNEYERYVDDVITRGIERIKKELGKEIGEEVKKEAVANLDKVIKEVLG